MDQVSYHETSEESKLQDVRLSHLSIEVGHAYLNDIANHPETVKADFERISPLIEPFIASAGVHFSADNVRASTCYLVDDYFQQSFPPKDILGKLLGAAAAGEVRIDYLVRESSCCELPKFVNGIAVGEPIRVAEMVAARIVEEPGAYVTGAEEPALLWRPADSAATVAMNGWLCNGQRSSYQSLHRAMDAQGYIPPDEFGKREHSIFIDVELWSPVDVDGEVTRRWSCPFLASVWQMLRLGMLRDHGVPVAQPQLWLADIEWPDNWAQLPPVIQLNPDAEPFEAYKTLSMLPKRFLAVEHAVRLILDHIHIDDDVVEQVIALAAEERIALSKTVTQRVSHLLFDGS